MAITPKVGKDKNKTIKNKRNLDKFIEDKDATAYAHLDIAGMANTSTAGATGFGVTTLFELASQGPKNHHPDEDMEY